MKTLAPYLAIAALGVRFPEVPEPNFFEVARSTFNPKRNTGAAALKRSARKNRNRRKKR